jgi:hypothetical protein
MVSRAVALILALCVATAAQAQQCRLALALALDISSSIDSREYRLQQEGLARALEDPAVRDAFLPGLPPVALAIYEWSNSRQQAIIQEWVMVTEHAVLDDVASRIRSHPRSATDQPTAIGNALLFGLALFNEAPPCAAQTLDLSGDGINNAGTNPARAYATAGWDGITVNALAIGNTRQMEIYYSRQVIRGHRAFVERASRFEDFGAAMERKLIREVLPDMMLGALE